MASESLARRSNGGVPVEHRKTFRNLYLDIGWFGVLNGSAIAMVAVFAVRSGASGFELGLLNALPGLVALTLSLPAGQWLGGRELGRTTLWLSVVQRLGYVGWAVVPLLPGEMVRLWVLIGLALLMSIPGTALAISFNSMFAGLVPLEWRGHVVGIRNALYAATFVGTSLGVGQILTLLPFETGYAVVFAIGGVAALMSSFHIWRALPGPLPPEPRMVRAVFGELAASPGRMFGRRVGVGLRSLIGLKPMEVLQTQLFGSARRRILVALFVFHLALLAGSTTFPLYFVRVLNLTDAQITTGAALFYVGMFVGSSQLRRLTDWMGTLGGTVLGAVMLGVYPLVMAATGRFDVYLGVMIYGGLSWALLNGGLSNYVLEVAGEEARAFFLAWFTLVTNAALLVGALAGPSLADWVGPGIALLVAGVLRILSAGLIWLWGRGYGAPPPRGEPLAED